MEVEKSIKNKAFEVGFDVIGFTDVATDKRLKTNLYQYLRDGRQGNMDWMAKNTDRRTSARNLWPEVNSIIVLGLNYGPAEPPTLALKRTDRGNISVYAQGKDYHDLVKKKLKEIGQWLVEKHACEIKVFVDTAPVMEKPLAQKAGLGWQGKHTNLVSPNLGSWLFLGEIFTTLKLTPDTPCVDQCGTCRACLDACPTDALDVPYQIDPRRCISYLTIEHKGNIPEDLASAMGNRIYGCDDCLDACPWNKFSVINKQDDFLPRAELSAPRLADLSMLNDADFRQIFSGSPIKRTGRERFVRNVIIAIANSGDRSLTKALTARLEDTSAIVRKAAQWALSRLQQKL